MTSKIVYLKTEHVIPMKILFEVMKDILPDTIIEFVGEPKPDDKKKQIIKKGNIQVKKNNIDKNKKVIEPVKWTGIRIMNVDPTKSILISLKLDGSQFQEFKCATEIFSIGVNLVALNKLLKTIDKEDELVMHVDSNNSQFLMISMFNNDLKRETEFKLKLMDLDPGPLKIPPTELDVVVTIRANEFHKVCRNMGQIADFIEIKCTEKSITFSCKSDSAEQQTSFMSSDGVKITYSEASKNKQLIVQGIYELSKLNIFNKCGSLCEEIQLFMRNDYPLCIQYTVATLGKFLVCIVPVNEKQTKDNFSDEDELYQSDDEEIKLKDNFIK